MRRENDLMRSYKQYCAMAKALDVIGERWTLLIVRELLACGPRRYTDLRNGLPGIATNLLADRLRELESEGIIYREDAPPPIATCLFRLTSRGKELAPLVRELGRWGEGLLAERDDDDEFRSHWLAVPFQLYLSDRTPERPPITIEVRTGDQPMVIETVEGAVQARPGRAEQPDAVLTGTPQLIMAVLTGTLELEDARARGLEYQGDSETLWRVRPEAPTSGGGVKAGSG
jgi:DNA-binding HxlR family transcriptional regulator